MKLLFLLIASIIQCHCAAVKDTNYVELDTTPFDVPEGDDNDDSPVQRGSRIVFGSAASAGQFPHYGFMYVNRPETTVQCGAGLISPSWCLTANHCVNSAKSIEVRFGVQHRNYYEQKIMVSGIARGIDADIALIKLVTSISVTKNVQPALLPRYSQMDQMLENKVGYVCGLGIENPSTNYVSQYLQYTSLKIMDNNDCSKFYGYQGPQNVCAVGNAFQLSSTCAGDSGSPLVIYEGNQAVIVGVVSFGAAKGCDLGYPVGYARTSYQLLWIQYYTGILRS